jgi:hypothetical protein
VAQKKPGETEGISRRTWYRRRPGTGMAPSKRIAKLLVGVRPVPRRKPLAPSGAAPTPKARHIWRDGVAILAAPAAGTHACNRSRGISG